MAKLIPVGTADRLLARLVGRPVMRRELWLLITVMAAGLALRIAFVLLTDGHDLGADETEHHVEAKFIAEGKWFWTTSPYGVAHESFFRAPLYPVWLGLIYTVFGVGILKALLLQCLLGPVTIFLTWILGARLFTRGHVAIAAAAIVAVYPNAWQWETRLFSESLATPLTIVVLIAVLTRPPTLARAAAVGGLMGVSLLLRPSALLLFAPILVAWTVATSWRRGPLLAGLTLVVALLVVAPWTARNAVLTGEFVPISFQDAAPYGTFNDTAASDPVWPWSWRPFPERDFDLLGEPRPDAQLRRELIDRAREYLVANPAAVPQAFFWNGLSRTWDIRRPARVLAEAPYEGRSKAVALVGLALYWLLLPLAIAGLWRWRARRELVLPVIAVAAASSIVFTVAALSRYRAPIEPLIVILACAALPLLAPRPAEPRE